VLQAGHVAEMFGDEGGRPHGDERDVGAKPSEEAHRREGGARRVVTAEEVQGDANRAIERRRHAWGPTSMTVRPS
jgi:hypothetical protein